MKRDLTLALTAGIIAGIFLIPTLRALNLDFPFKYYALFVVLPLGSVTWTYVMRKMSVRAPWLLQLAKFSVTGGMNGTIDFGVLNLLILATMQASGIYFSLFKTISFLVANINSYFWNKLWTFAVSTEQSEAGAISEEGRKSIFAGREFLKFFVISSGGLILNVGIASIVVNLIGPQFGLGTQIWANVGALIGVVGNMGWNFLGYKFIVFNNN